MDSKSGIGRKSFFIFLIKLIITLVSWAGVFFVARLMGSEVWGMIGFAVGLGGMFFQSDFGFGLAHNKKVSEGKDIGQCLGTYIRIKLVLTLILIVALAVGILVWENILGFGYEDPEVTSVLFFIILYYIFFTLSQIPVQTFGGLRQSVKQQMPEFIGTVVRAPLMIAVAVLGLGVIWLSYSFVVSGVLMLIISFYLMRRHKVKKPTPELHREYMTFAAPLAIYVFFSTVSLNLDKVVLQLFWNLREVGIFFMMQKMIMVMIIITSSLGPIFFPSISYYHSRKAIKYVRYLVKRAERYMSMVITPIVAIMIPLATQAILILAGNDFVDGSRTLAWLGIYGLLLSLNVAHFHMISGCGRPDLSAKVGLSIAFTNIILLFILVPRDILGFQLFGLASEGAAMASTISVAVGFVLARKYSNRIAGVRSNRHVYKHWVAGFLTTGLIYLILDNVWNVARWFELIGISAIGLGAYVGLLVLMKEFTKKDLDFFLDLLNPRKMGKYVGGELRE